MLRNVLFVACLILPSLSLAADNDATPDSKPDSKHMVNGYHLTAAPSPSQQLTDEIAQKDDIFFDAFFNKCDLVTAGSLVTDDFEFYHDKGGLTVSKEKFIDSLKGTCDRQRTGEDFRSKRELVKGSMAVYPINNYGAVETGTHRFYMVQEGKPDTLTEESLFTIVWKKDASGWKMARALSYSHKLTN